MLAVATLAAQTPDYKVLTNQEDAPVSVYIDSVALQLNLSHHSTSILVLYVLRAPNPDSVSHRVIQTEPPPLFCQAFDVAVFLATSSRCRCAADSTCSI